LFRDENQPQAITKKAVKNTPVLIEYQNQRPARPEPASALSQQFKGSFCKIYLPDKDGSFPKGEREWWIEDVKIQDTKVVPEINDQNKKSHQPFFMTIRAGMNSRDDKLKRAGPGTTIVVTGPQEGTGTSTGGKRRESEFKWGFDGILMYSVNSPGVFPAKAKEIIVGFQDEYLGADSNYTFEVK